VSLVGAFFFPVGLIMLVLTGQELVTANFSEWTKLAPTRTVVGVRSGGLGQ
jgi:formate/nitrite transporter FocA (FNT family)